MPSSGPDIARASSGRAPLSACTEDSAIGSTSTFHTSVVPTTHSARLHAAVEVTPEGNSVVSSSQWSASRSASATASFCCCVGDGSGDWATVLRASVEHEVPVHRAVVRLHQELELAEDLVEVGHPAAGAAGSAGEGTEDLLERRALEGVLRVVGRLARLVVHGLHGTRAVVAALGSGA